MVHTMESWLYIRTDNYLYEAKLKVGVEVAVLGRVVIRCYQWDDENVSGCLCVKENLPVLTGYIFLHGACQGPVQESERYIM